MKNSINIFLILILLQSFNIKSEQDLSDFDKGNTFNECLSNCRYYHRHMLNLKRGEGQGVCWDICNENYQ